MTKTPKTLYAQANEEHGKIVWSLDDKKNVDKGKRKTINYPKGSGEYDITIEFTDETDRGIVFKATDPIWVQDGGSCPPSSGVNSAQIPPQSIQCGTDTLRFTNFNSSQCTLVYQLNFVDTHEKDIKPQLDPEFKNGGGGGFAVSSYVAAGVVGAAILALALCTLR